MMGVLPLQFMNGESAESLGLTGEEEISVNIAEGVKPRDILNCYCNSEDGTVKEFEVLARFDSEVEVDYYRHGGILQMVLRNKVLEA